MKYNSTINLPKCYWPKKGGSQPKWQNPKYNWDLLILCTRLARIWNQVLFHPELTPWWSFLFTNGAHHKKLHSPTHPKFLWITPSQMPTDLIDHLYWFVSLLSHFWYHFYTYTWFNQPYILVNIGSGNGLVPSGNKPLPESMLTQTYAAT